MESWDIRTQKLTFQLHLDVSAPFTPKFDPSEEYDFAQEKARSTRGIE